MSNINDLTYEVWYKYSENSTPRKIAAFNFYFEAEKYIALFHPNDAQRYYIYNINSMSNSPTDH